MSELKQPESSPTVDELHAELDAAGHRLLEVGWIRPRMETDMADDNIVFTPRDRPQRPGGVIRIGENAVSAQLENVDRIAPRRAKVER